MFSMVLNIIENNVKKYTEALIFTNKARDLAVQLECMINEEDKEKLLNDLDKELPDGLYFSHEYKDGKLKIIFKVFKEVSQ